MKVRPRSVSILMSPGSLPNQLNNQGARCHRIPASTSILPIKISVLAMFEALYVRHFCRVRGWVAEGAAMPVEQALVYSLSLILKSALERTPRADLGSFDFFCRALQYDEVLAIILDH